MVSDVSNSDTDFVTATDSSLKTLSSTLTRTSSGAAETATSPLRNAAAHLNPTTSHPGTPRSPLAAGSPAANGALLHHQPSDDVATPSHIPHQDEKLVSNTPTNKNTETNSAKEEDQQPDHDDVPGTSHFSVPPSVPPQHGVYVYPQEAFVISDLDTGRKFEVNQQFWIKDVDSGAVYIVQDPTTPPNNKPTTATTTSPLASGGVVSRPPSSVSSAGAITGYNSNSPTKDIGAPSSSTRSVSPVGTTGGGGGSIDNDAGLLITDLMSGEKLSIKDFEEAMGYTKVSTKETLAVPLSPPQISSLHQPHGGKVEQLAQRGLITFNAAATASASWVKNKTAAALSIVGPTRKESPVTGFIGSGGGIGGVDSMEERSMGGSFGTAAVPSDLNGIPVRVTVHRKNVKELADLRLVQEIQGHQGVVWAMKFSRNGRYLATAGQDGILRVWESIPNRGSINTGTTVSPSGTPLGGGSSPTQQPGTPTRGGIGNNNSTTTSLNQQQQNQPQIERISTGTGTTAPSSPHGSTGGNNNVSSFNTIGGGIDTGIAAVPGSPTVLASSCPGVAVIKSRPYRTYRGHKQDVLDVAWSRTHFLLSASMDKTVRLWHVSMDECLRVFKHSDFVTAIDFHPTDDKLFVSGSIDGKIRLWNVPDQRVMSWQDVHEMVTAVGYGRDAAARAVVGTMRGKCRFYSAGERTGLEYEAQLDVKNKRGQHARGKKVTGVVYSPVQAGSLLVTSNDSRIRLYDGYALRCKFKGHTNRSTQIRASFSPRGDYVICGSDTGWVYVWNTNKQPTSNNNSINTSVSPVPPTNTTTTSSSSASPLPPSQPSPGGTNKEKNSSCECFQVASDIVTVAIFAPESSQRNYTGTTSNSSGASGSGKEGSGSGTRQGTAAGAVPPEPSRLNKNSMGGSSGGSGNSTAWAARGQVILAAGYGGEIKIYENMATHPQTL